MRSRYGSDQADGLRRLLLANHTRLITVVAGKAGMGRSSMTINLAAALAHAGKDVLVLDENHAPNNLAERLMLPAREDLLDVAQGRCSVQQAVMRAQGFSVMSAARAMNALSRLHATEQQRLEQALTEICSGVDVVLVDAALLSGRAAVSSSMASGVSLLVVVDATVSGITEGYALIKRLALENARLQFEVVVNKVDSEQEARSVFENMSSVARHHLAARLGYLGHVPRDAKLARATQLGRTVVEAFPTASSARAYMELALRLSRLPLEQGEPMHDVSHMMQSLKRQMCNLSMAHAVS